MIVGYFDEKGVLIYHPASTAAYYLKGAFLVDVIAALPLENLVDPKRERYRQYLKAIFHSDCNCLKGNVWKNPLRFSEAFYHTVFTVLQHNLPWLSRCLFKSKVEEKKKG